MIRILIAIALIAGIPALVACSGDSDDGTANDNVATPSTDPIDRNELLNSLEDVRAMIAAAANLDPTIAQDVEYGDGTLTVTLADDQTTPDTAAMQSLCEDISSAVALPDLEVRLQTPDGAIAARCTFGS